MKTDFWSEISLRKISNGQIPCEFQTLHNHKVEITSAGNLKHAARTKVGC